MSTMSIVSRLSVTSTIAADAGANAAPLLMAAYDDLGNSGKLFFAGSGASTVAKSVLEALLRMPGRRKAELGNTDKKDWSHVLTGIEMIDKKCGYFPRTDVIQGILATAAHLGWGLIACPSFHQGDGSCVSFVWEWQGLPRCSVFIAFSDMPFRVGVSGVDGNGRRDSLS